MNQSFVITNERPVSGVYLLFDRQRLVYVGKSTDCKRRIADHARNGRAFDYATVMALPDGDETWIEEALIRRLGPPQNRSHNTPRPEPVTDVEAFPVNLSYARAPASRRNEPAPAQPLQPAWIRFDNDGLIPGAIIKEIAADLGIPEKDVLAAVDAGDIPGEVQAPYEMACHGVMVPARRRKAVGSAVVSWCLDYCENVQGNTFIRSRRHLANGRFSTAVPLDDIKHHREDAT